MVVVVVMARRQGIKDIDKKEIRMHIFTYEGGLCRI